MNTLKHSLLLAAASLLTGSLAWAQPGPGMGGGMGSGMGPGAGPANRPCMAAGQARPTPQPMPQCNWRANRRNTPGLALMTPEERSAHRDRMRGMQSREECLAYLTEHHAQMAERAKAKGQTLPEPRARMCERLPSATQPR
ncbi:hypothetical protein [Zoogloea sp.]|jgi:hypothetical protein|uniref:hypothetical protein n=1 Tax=Zoogloea sp. TaxID=49181 RepID=UPI0035AFAD6D